MKRQDGQHKMTQDPSLMTGGREKGSGLSQSQPGCAASLATSISEPSAAHEPNCRLVKAATCAVGIECEHGFDVCPVCDRCTCGPFQARVEPWMRECFGDVIPFDREERGDRLLEEVFELLQSGGYDPARILALRDYVWGRDVGDPPQELGGVMVTLAAYSLAFGLDMHLAGETELARVWTKVPQIRAKQAAKPTGSALPIASASPAERQGPGPGKPTEHLSDLRESGWRPIESAPRDGAEIEVARIERAIWRPCIEGWPRLGPVWECEDSNVLDDSECEWTHWRALSKADAILALGEGSDSSVARADMTPPSGASDGLRKSEEGQP